MTDKKIKPSRGYYVLAFLILVAGCFIAVLIPVISARGSLQEITQTNAELRRVIMPGVEEIELANPGKYTVYHEYQTVLEGRVYTSPETIPGLECSLVSKASGAQITLSAPTVSSTYTVGGRKATSILEFNIDQPGRYIFSCSLAGMQVRPVVLAIGQGMLGSILGLVGKNFLTISGSLVVCVGSLVIAVILAIVVFSRRKKAVRTLETS
ncbi:MAG: hypothetical protein AB1345_06920 [Chloroflexota bacterium]